MSVYTIYSIMKKIPVYFSYFLVAAVMTGPAVILADHTDLHTIQQIQKQLSILSKKIEAAKKLGALQATPPVCSPLTTQLRKGDRDSDAKGEVGRLQKFLARDATIYPEGIVSGYFGNLTEQAVKRWQTKYGIVSYGDVATTGYGSVGPKTRSKMADLWSKRSLSQVDISGNPGGWIYTELAVFSGEVIKINAAGTIAYDSSGRIATPDGSQPQSLSSNSLVPTLTHGSLVGRIGDGSLKNLSGFLVGSSVCKTDDKAGSLFLGFNDGYVQEDRNDLNIGGVGDNSGSFKVDITIFE